MAKYVGASLGFILALAVPSSSIAAQYYYRQKMVAPPPPIITPAPPPDKAPVEPTPVTIDLTGMVLPDGMVDKDYHYDLKTLATVTGVNRSDLTWTTNPSSPVPGLSLDAGTGVISGKPTTENEYSFEVIASREDKEGRKIYTIRVGATALEVVQLAPGGYHTCALTPSNGVKCWGHNSYGSLGNMTTKHSNVPVDVVGLTSGVSSVSSGLYHSCATLQSGGVKCWGQNNYGQLGKSVGAFSTSPVDVNGLSSGVAKVVAGYYHTCAITVTQGAKCWGYNQSGQLGNGLTANSTDPVDVVGLESGVTALAGNGYHFTCAVVSKGAKCWGNNTYSQIGDQGTSNRNVPTDVNGLSTGVSDITIGNNFACALLDTGGVKCWGANADGQLGNNTITNSKVPVDVSGMTSGVVKVTAGGYYACALTALGGIKCWGKNDFGQLGNNTVTGSRKPVDVVGMGSGVTEVQAGHYHACAIGTAGGAKCWGWNTAGQLGNKTTTDSRKPVNVSPM